MYMVCEMSTFIGLSPALNETVCDKYICTLYFKPNLCYSLQSSWQSVRKTLRDDSHTSTSSW